MLLDESCHGQKTAHELWHKLEALMTDFRLSRTGGGTVPMASHSLRDCLRVMASHSLRECLRVMVRRCRLFAYLGYPVHTTTPMLLCMLAWLVDGTDFRPSRSGDGTVPAAAPSLRVCGGAMARRRKLFADLGYPAGSLRCLHTRIRTGTRALPAAHRNASQRIASHRIASHRQGEWGESTGLEGCAALAARR